MKVKELSVEQLKALIQEAVEEKFYELLGDPDLGLELKDDIRDRLQNSLIAEKRGEYGVPINQVSKELGIKWE